MQCLNKLVTTTYGENLEANLRDLSDRLKQGTYHASPVERVYIPKADGRQRPLGLPMCPAYGSNSRMTTNLLKSNCFQVS
jgi:hypothetical protein